MCVYEKDVDPNRCFPWKFRQLVICVSSKQTYIMIYAFFFLVKSSPPKNGELCVSEKKNHCDLCVSFRRSQHVVSVSLEETRTPKATCLKPTRSLCVYEKDVNHNQCVPFNFSQLVICVSTRKTYIVKYAFFLCKNPKNKKKKKIANCISEKQSTL